MRSEQFTILLADDDADDHLFFREAINEIETEADLIIVKDGIQLMKHLANPSTAMPNMVFLDLNMPLKGGLECLKEIRSNSNLKDLSVAIYSTSAAERDVQETFSLGANVYIKKPNDYPTLKKIIADIVTGEWQMQTASAKENYFLNT
jgi:CheY-like chemotaxis protein